ncbi:hemopexin repeat-containing protein [Phyllobacteriaceae bacterium JZ32]
MAPKIYFFKGDKYVQIDPTTNTVDQNPRLIADDWKGLKEIGFDSNIDAAEYLNGMMYLFKNNEYVMYNIEEDSASGGKNNNINIFHNIPKEFLSGIDA